MQYPVGGPREPVYALMRSLGLSESNWSDKVWHGAGGVKVSIYGDLGPKRRVSIAGNADAANAN